VKESSGSRRRVGASDASRIARLVARFPRARVMVIGDLMLDQFVWGAVRRISPEAPVPVVHVTRESAHPGGAGNVVANLAALGTRPTVVGWVGRDPAGRTISSLLHHLGADTSGIVTSSEVTSIEKTRIIAHSQQVVRLDRESVRSSPRLARQVLGRLETLLDGVAAVVVSDYGKGTVTKEMLDFLAERRARQGFLLLIDPKQPNFPHYRGATLIKPNESEASAAAGSEIEDEPSLEAVGARLLERWQSEAVLVSRGEHGMSLYRRGVPPSHFQAAAREVFDVTGAGDTVMAVAGVALAAGGSLEDAAYLANLGAGIVVGKVGTATVSRDELIAAVGQNDRRKSGRPQRKAGRR
jgi:D-beta-D-heptose 7-phosphate kinase/D-beta-D-heptose 1-phosphate adenosyltransferase